MSNAELFQALGMFREGLKDLFTQRTISQANEQVNQIKSSELDEAKQRSALQGVANQLTMQLAGLGTPATTIAQVAGAVGPQRFGSPDQMIMEGVMSGDKALQQKGVEADELTTSNQLKLYDRKAQIDEARQARMLENQLRMAERQAGSAPQKNLPMTQGMMDKIQTLDEESIAANSLLEQLSENENLVGIGLNVPGAVKVKALTDPKFDSFNAEVGRWFDSYRKRITGAGASGSELAMLKQNVPKVTDNPENFRVKMAKILEIGGKVRERYMNTLKQSKRDTSGFEPEQSSAKPQQPTNPYFTPYK